MRKKGIELAEYIFPWCFGFLSNPAGLQFLFRWISLLLTIRAYFLEKKIKYCIKEMKKIFADTGSV